MSKSNVTVDLEYLRSLEDRFIGLKAAAEEMLEAVKENKSVPIGLVIKLKMALNKHD